MKPSFGPESVDIFPVYFLVVVKNPRVNSNDGATRDIVAVDFSSLPWDFAFENCARVGMYP